jgi:23S rRNA pseudouridine1911/1915/1917 synthase
VRGRREPRPGDIRELSPGPLGEPRLLAETGAYLVVYKPPLMHSVPLKKKGAPSPGEGSPGAAAREISLLDWCAGLFPEVRDLQNRGQGEGGILHRLDYDTRGLVLFARTQEVLEELLRQQEEGLFFKEYEALSAEKAPGPSLPGFPPPPAEFSPGIFGEPPWGFGEGEEPRFIESAFRPYGPGRQAVRPLAWCPGAVLRRGEYALDRGKPYRTEIRAWEKAGQYRRFILGITRGFRHQIRCHLSWIGFPLLNDRRYGGPVTPGPCFLALRARGFSFQDPLSRTRREYRLLPEEEQPDFRRQVEGAGS